jgi:glycosyltransferase involved in cell wall biosynthesis
MQASRSAGVLVRETAERTVLDSANIWIVIPAYNEASVIADVVARCRAVYEHVMVIDDCSSDRTGELARRAGAVVARHPINLGQGAALQTGIRYSLDQGADLIVTFDADGQHRVEDIAVLLRKLESTDADLVLGSRFLGRAEAIPPVRKAILRLATRFTRLTTGLELTDVHNGLRVFTRGAAERIRILQNRMAHASELLEQIGSLQLKIAEAPVTIVYSEYSLRKGQKLSNAFNILADLMVARLSK